MGTLQTDIIREMRSAEARRKNVLRVIVGELQRQNKKNLSDKEVVRIIKKLVKSEKEMLREINRESSYFLTVYESYLPPMVPPEEIERWIKENVSLSNFEKPLSNKAIGVVMKHFGQSADGNVVRRIIQNLVRPE